MSEAILTGSKCWFCGKEISNPKYFVTEKLIDFGVHKGRTQSTPIHKTCHEKAVNEGGIAIFFINGLEVWDSAK